MKTTFKILVCLAAITLIASCGKTPYKLLKQKDGTWIATTVTSITGFPTITNVDEFTFYEGSATSIDTGGVKTGFNWAYDKKSEKIKLTVIAGKDAYNAIYKVTSFDKDSEKWTFESRNRNDTLISIDNYTQTISLVRK